MSERNERKTEEKNLLAAYYGKKAFLKIKQCLEIDKIQFSFVEKDDAKNHIDCYMEAVEFGAILMQGIKNASLLKALYDEKKKGDQYPKAVFTSPIGGNATGNKGKPVSRYFTISPASSGEVLFTAYSFPAEKSPTGAFIKVKDSKPIITLRVPCSINDLKVLAYKWSFLENDYMSKKYSFENMKSDYQPKCDDTYDTSVNEPSEDDMENKSSSYDVEDVPFVGTDSPVNEDKEKLVESKMKTIKLVATSALEVVKGKNIKVCRVTLDGTERRLICLMDKIKDERFPVFEDQLNSRVASKKTLEFKAEVAEKGSDLYLKRFA